jgi:hypothetical protein
MALFGPSPAERERYRRECREGRFGMRSREVMVRRGLIIEPEPEPPLRNAWRPEPTPTPPPRPMRMYLAKPAKPFGQMSDAEIEDFARQFVRGMAQVARATDEPAA